MSGYHRHSFDPNAYEQAGAPLKPFNWVQWTGVAIGFVGIMLITLDVLGRIGWTPRWIDDPSPASFMLLVVGMTLVNSRREPGTIINAEQRGRNKRVLIVTVAICAAVLGAALVVEFTGV